MLSCYYPILVNELIGGILKLIRSLLFFYIYSSLGRFLELAEATGGMKDRLVLAGLSQLSVIGFKI